MEENMVDVVFMNWFNLYIDLGGNKSISDFSNYIEIKHAMRYLEGGSSTIMNEYMRQDTMKCEHRHVANIYKLIWEDMYIIQKEYDTVYKYSKVDGLWFDNERHIKRDIGQFFDVYMDQLERCSPNRYLFPEGEDENYRKNRSKYISYINSFHNLVAVSSQFKLIINQVETKFDCDPDKFNIISFKNGIYNLDTGAFRKRENYDFLTRCLDFDYQPLCDEKLYLEIKEFFCKIHPQKEQHDFCISFLKYSLRGGNPIAIFKVNIGPGGANGKSTETEIHEMVFPIYTYKMNRNVFTKGFTKIHKFMYKLITDPIRLAYINELDDSKLDEDFIKDIIDCKTLQLEEMYSKVSRKTDIQCKILTTSNKDPNLNVDAGILRRMTVQHYESQFVDPEHVDTSRHKYPIDRTFTERFKRNDYKLAYFHYIMNAPDVSIPEANKDLAKSIVENNDKIYSTLTDHFTITGNHDDKVHMSRLKSYFPDMTIQSLNKELKRFNINYDKNGAVDGIRKVYRGLVPVVDIDTSDD